MSDSNSQTDQSTSYTDNREVLGEGANHAENGSTINNFELDNGAISDAFRFAGHTVTQAFNFGDHALDSNVAVTNDALHFADNTVNDALAANAAAMRIAANSQAEALSFADSAQKTSARAQTAALDTAADSMAGALAYSGRQTAVALDSLTGSANLVKDAYADAKGRGALTDKLLEACNGSLDNPANCQGLLNLATPLMWLREGCDLDADIIPALRGMGTAAHGRRITTWNYFTNGIRRARDTRVCGLPPPAPVAPAGKARGSRQVPLPEGKSFMDMTKEMLAKIEKGEL